MTSTAIKSKGINMEELKAVIKDVPNSSSVLTYIIATLTGMVGGCASIAFVLSRAKRWTLYLIAYLIIGAISGVVSTAVILSGHELLGIRYTGIDSVLAISGAASLITTFSVGMTNIIVGVTLRFKDLEAKLVFEKKKPASEVERGKEN